LTLQSFRGEEGALLERVKVLNRVAEGLAEEACLLDDGVELGADGGADQGEAEAELAADCATGATAYGAAD
jgi:hypothetical protein